MDKLPFNDESDQKVMHSHFTRLHFTAFEKKRYNLMLCLGYYKKQKYIDINLTASNLNRMMKSEKSIAGYDCSFMFNTNITAV